MKAPIISLVAATLVAGCGAVPFRYDGPDAATLAGEFGASKTMVVEVNGQRREPPYAPGPIKVRPGLLRVGINLHDVSGQRFGAECIELEAQAGSLYRFSVSAESNGFLVSLYEGEGEGRKLVGRTLAPFRNMGQLWDKERCPKES
jgi:hypothetical protein